MFLAMVIRDGRQCSLQWCGDELTVFPCVLLCFVNKAIIVEEVLKARLLALPSIIAKQAGHNSALYIHKNKPVLLSLVYVLVFHHKLRGGSNTLPKS